MSIYDIFTEMHLRATADLVSNHEQNIRHLAAQMGLDPDQAWIEAQIPKVEMSCPVCGQPATMSILCRGCGGGAFSDCGDAELAAARQHLLNLPVETPQARQYAAAHAFNPSGCMVCPNCIEQTLASSAVCPLLWIISPRSGLTHLALIQLQDHDPDDEYQLLYEMWTEILADGPASHWRYHLFHHAIPAAFQSLIP